MSSIPKISEAEWEVMKIIWNKNPCTANEIIKYLEGSTEWKPKTVKSLISRLLKKNAISFNEEGRTYYYYPLVNEKECIKEESKSFIQRVYNGAAKNMLLNFIEDNKLTEEDIDDLKRILDDRK
ncbi:BlaI/MecI/CopY family transcriptional regulator [Clostridium sp. JS66]|uniref:BlaI/MecI/CopY family transcriptional regulator n=1 Tax=Clostridium sp. JS66 TaxID=3064705 RepID=UPI00298E7376|nr:BlaI/MecI/CopY family transcriptional regulator [Clostridium sp. JS66]WPC43491.1 BlaI/MecI/CopY family transcriptional regulator [Clostridium sp. JS66]